MKVHEGTCYEDGYKNETWHGVFQGMYSSIWTKGEVQDKGLFGFWKWHFHPFYDTIQYRGEPKYIMDDL